MDNLAFDQMLPEYQERRQEAADIIAAAASSAITDSNNNSPPSPSEDYEAFIGGKSTVPVNDEEPHLPIALVTTPDSVVEETNSSRNSSTSSSGLQDSSIGSASIYHHSVITPSINYERESPDQKLVAVFGRQFDMPNEVASCLQKLANGLAPGKLPIKFVPFTMKRNYLLKGNYDSEELLRHDLVCMCYNASEARILLTGMDGFYTSLLKHAEAILGPNKVAFLITNYRQPSLDNSDELLIFPSLKTRLHGQEPLKPYLLNEQILSWTDTPRLPHVQRLVQLAELERNPKSFLSVQSCVCL